jgi:SpoVK/Ycf46/Vps4 family AAA+-type ATPase
LKYSWLTYKFSSKYVGEGEKLVRPVFSLARRLAPCVVFIDKIDAHFGARSSPRGTGGGFVHRSVVTEFMQEMDGLKTSNPDNVIVIGATNRPFDLDDAVLRRLPRRLLMDLPGEKKREGKWWCSWPSYSSVLIPEILKILLRDEDLSPEVDLKVLARGTPTFSASDLKRKSAFPLVELCLDLPCFNLLDVCISAALDAVKENVSVPWVVERSRGPSQDALQTSNADNDGAAQPSNDSAALATQKRILRPHNFTKALKEITPSASESLGTLPDLRKWNDEFGEGRKRKRQS